MGSARSSTGCPRATGSLAAWVVIARPLGDQARAEGEPGGEQMPRSSRMDSFFSVDRFSGGATHRLTVMGDIGDFDQFPGEFHPQVLSSAGRRLEEILATLNTRLTLFLRTRAPTEIFVIRIVVPLAHQEHESARERLAQVALVRARAP